MTTATHTITPLEAAQQCAAKLRRDLGIPDDADYGPTVWDANDVAHHGWGRADAQVCWEEGPFEWSYDFTGTNGQPYSGVYVEPYNGWLLGFYKEA